MTLSSRHTGFKIRALAVWGRARYLSVTEAHHNTDFPTWMGKKLFCFLQTSETGNWTPNSGVNGSGANHYPRAPPVLVRTATRRQTTVTSRLKSKQLLLFANSSNCLLFKRAVTAALHPVLLVLACPRGRPHHQRSSSQRGVPGGPRFEYGPSARRSRTQSVNDRHRLAAARTPRGSILPTLRYYLWCAFSWFRCPAAYRPTAITWVF